MPAKEYVCTLKSTKNLTPSVFQLSCEPHESFQFEAGQYISVAIPGVGPGGRTLRRAYSIASVPGETQIQLCVKRVEHGPGSGYLGSLKPGDAFKAIAPYGDFVYEPKLGKSVFFIATGTGIAPIRSMVLSDVYQSNPPQKAVCLLGVRGREDILYENDLANVSGLEFVIALSQASESWKGFKGRVTDYVKALESSYPWTESDFYLCGHGGMVDEVKEFLEDKGVIKESIHHEIYYK